MTPIPLLIETDLERLRGEFLEMPGLILTVAQASRLLGIRVREAARLLADLDREGFLLRTGAGAYRLALPPLA